jgi:hypothetical protein
MAAQAHTLKSMVGLFTMSEAFAAARELEAIGKQGDLDRAAQASATLEDAVASLETRLRVLRAELEK